MLHPAPTAIVRSYPCVVDAVDLLLADRSPGAATDEGVPSDHHDGFQSLCNKRVSDYFFRGVSGSTKLCCRESASAG